MKKTLSILLAVFFLFGMSSLNFAQAAQEKSTKKTEAKIEVTKGEITAIDANTNQITVKDIKAGQDKVFTLDAKDIAGLKVGDKVKVKVEAGTNVVKSVKKIKSEAGKKK